MKINDKYFSLPPYISTSWKNVQGLHMKGNILVVTLNFGETVNIPGLKADTLENIFNAHSSFLEQDTTLPQKPSAAATNPYGSIKPHLFTGTEQQQQAEVPFRLGFGGFDGFGSAMQHNPAHADMPELPKEILQKIGAIAKIVAPEDIEAMPKPEPHCNCPHCQIARAINQTMEVSTEAEAPVEEEVSESDLNFQQWQITQAGDKLFNVINKLDTNEKYSVYLGHPVGCTCGKPGCEHILAVLKS